MGRLKREQIKTMLEELAKKPGRSDPIGFINAACYSRSAPSDRMEYVCPTCGERTLYIRPKNSGDDDDYDPSEDNEDIDVVEYLETRRLDIRAIDKLSITLDESEFCKRCKPNVSKPRLRIIIKADDDSELYADYSDDPITDLTLIREFLDREHTHRYGFCEKPLRDCLPRLCELLGVGKQKK